MYVPLMFPMYIYLAGFELGFSMTNPFALVCWEAQFGDFNNTAQVYTVAINVSLNNVPLLCHTCMQEPQS